MPIQLDWLNKEQTIIYVRFLGRWNRHSYTTLVDTSKSMIESVEHQVHQIHDFTQSHSTPRDLLAGMQYANKQLAPNQGLTILLHANSVIQAYVLMAKRTGLPLANHIYQAISTEDALQVIRKKAKPTKTS